MAARVEQYSSAMQPPALSPNSPTASLVSQQAFPPRSSSMRHPQPPAVTVDIAPGVSLESPPGSSYAQFLRTWTDAHVARWLADNKCGHLATIFRTNDIRGDILLELDQTTLKEMDVSSIGDRLRIMNALKALRLQCSSRAIRSPVSGPPSAMSHTPDTDVSSPTSKPVPRRLDAGRPAPLQIPQGTPQHLPRVDRAGDSARRPLPFPTPTTATPQAHSGGSGSSSSNSQDRNIVGTPISQTAQARLPAAQSQQPPRAQPPRPNNRNHGYRTPTHAEVNQYNNAPLPPPPGQSTLPFPSTPSHRTAAAYGLPADPRPGNIGGSWGPVRANSPFNGTPTRQNAAFSPDQSTAHARNTSLDKLNGVAGPSKPPPRAPAHPYAASASQLPVPLTHGPNLSPIVEGFASQPAMSRTPSPPAYSVGRGPFQRGANANANAQQPGPSLDELRRKVHKFSMPEQNQTRTIDVSSAAAGVDVLEKALKKFGVVSRPLEVQDYLTTASGGLVVDGWAAFLDWDGNLPSSGCLESLHGRH
jgi:mitogen-activated protein kinase kinase kinase